MPGEDGWNSLKETKYSYIYAAGRVNASPISGKQISHSERDFPLRIKMDDNPTDQWLDTGRRRAMSEGFFLTVDSLPFLYKTGTALVLFRLRSIRPQVRYALSNYTLFSANSTEILFFSFRTSLLNAFFPFVTLFSSWSRRQESLYLNRL